MVSTTNSRARWPSRLVQRIVPVAVRRAEERFRKPCTLPIYHLLKGTPARHPASDSMTSGSFRRTLIPPRRPRRIEIYGGRRRGDPQPTTLWRSVGKVGKVRDELHPPPMNRNRLLGALLPRTRGVAFTSSTPGRTRYPEAHNSAASNSISMPSATSSSPRACARVIAAETIAALPRSRPRPSISNGRS